MAADNDQNPVDELAEEFANRIRAGEPVSIDDYVEKHPQLADEIRNLFPLILQFEQVKLDETSESDFVATDAFGGWSSVQQTTHDGKSSVQGVDDELKNPNGDDIIGTAIGRYKIKRKVGEGGFGCVYAAHDRQLQRDVAIKLPHAAARKRADVDAMIREARLVAKLEHAGIVSVYDAGQTDDGTVFIVSRLINGESLAHRMRRERVTVENTIRMISGVAETLDYAHSCGLVHRDIKPENILLDTHGQPFVTDFGIALSDADVLESIQQAGTPRYMSPEQARGEGHLLDGRSDIFSLGVVLYELLTGSLPFEGTSVREIVEQILNSEPTPLRQVATSISAELEWVCLKMLSKRAKDRHAKAIDVATDLSSLVRSNNSGQATALISDMNLVPADNQDGISGVVPKGLAAFDRGDADFFLRLLPGPYDRSGLPDCIRFWKHRIEERTPDRTFRVGVLYGPSGCGKTSLIQAGILPRLSNEIDAIFISASGSDLCVNLEKLLHQHFPELPEDADLKESFGLIRRNLGPQSGRKIVLLIDQFEQFLHAADSVETDELASALRHCDAVHLQTILLVRVDYWLGLTRFFQKMEPPDLDATNSRIADLFDVPHSRKVLIAFGRAFEKLPPVGQELGPDQKEFIETVLDELQENGEIIAVRLSMFADMMKHRDWVPGTLEQLGGIRGIGVRFLDETIGADSRHPIRQKHRAACREVLALLLPDAASDLKGSIHSERALAQGAGYGRRDDFDVVLQILDGELRLITPVNDDLEVSARSTHRSYQLSHDYLVPILREWLTLQQKQTRRGRAGLMLKESAALWNRKPIPGLLPRLSDFIRIKCFVPRHSWSVDESKMMAATKRRYAQRTFWWGLALILFAGSIGFSLRFYRFQRASDLTHGLLTSEVERVSLALDRLSPHFHLAEKQLLNVTPKNRDSHLRASLALAAIGHDRNDILCHYLLDSGAMEFRLITSMLNQDKSRRDLRPLWDALQDTDLSEAARFRAACALSMFADSTRGDTRLAPYSTLIAEQLVVHAGQKTWSDAIESNRDQLIDELIKLSHDSEWRGDQRAMAATLSVQYADEIDQLIKIWLQSERTHLAIAAAGIEAYTPRTELIDRLMQFISSDMTEPRQMALAAIGLFQLGKTEESLSVLNVNDDASARGFFVSLLPETKADASLLLARLNEESSPARQRGLILCIADLKDQIVEEKRRAWSERFLTLHEQTSDAGVRAACEYLFRHWKLMDRSHQPANSSDEQLAEKRGWFINSAGQTLSIVEATEFEMGSPESETYHLSTEKLRRQNIHRKFAIQSRPVTQREFNAFLLATDRKTEDTEHSEDAPATWVNWFEAAEYCNWLSEQDGINTSEWCFEVESKDGQTLGARLATNCLEKKGYRLPTESEWEYACRCGRRPVTSRYYGSSDELLSEYAWFKRNSNGKPQPCSVLKPSDWGLFDMHGNVWEWSLTPAGRFGEDISQAVHGGTEMKMQGGAFLTNVEYVRTACSYLEKANTRNGTYGFRVVRTLSD